MLSHKAKNHSQRMSTREVTVSQDSYPRLLEEFILSLRKLRFTTNPIGFSKLQLEKHLAWVKVFQQVLVIQQYE